MSLGSLVLVGVIADSQVIVDGGAPAASGLSFEALFETGTDADFTRGSNNTPVSTQNVSTSTISGSDVLKCASGGILYLLASNWGTRLGNEGCLRYVVRNNIQTAAGWEVDVRDSSTRADLNSVDGPDRMAFFGMPNNVNVKVTNGSGFTVIESAFGGSTPVLIEGSIYELEFNWRTGASVGDPTGSIWCFISGSQLGNTLSGSWLHGAHASVIKFGRLMEGDPAMDGFFDNIRMFADIQHEKGSNYTPDF